MASLRGAGTSAHRRLGMGRTGAAWRTSFLAETLPMKNAAPASAATASAVLRRQCRGSAYQPPAGDQMCLVVEEASPAMV